MQELPFQEIEALLESVIFNRYLVQLKTEDGVEFAVFSHPSSRDLLLSRYMRDKALLEAEKEGLPSLEEAEVHLDKVMSQDEKDAIKELEEKIEAQKKVLEVTAIEARRESVRENIDRLKGELQRAQNKSQNYLYMTRERKADEESFLYLAWASAYTVTGERFWKTFEDFENTTSFDIRSSLLEGFASFNVGFSSEKIRFLARHSLWRIRYVASMKTNQTLFGDNALDLTPDQLSLLYWANYYQSIYEMMPDEQPSQEIVNDDAKLDEYMDSYFENREKDKNEGKAQSRSQSKKLNAWDKGEELIITPSHPDYMKLAYTKQRVKSAEGTSEVEIISPNSRRARNKRARATSQAKMRGGRR
jgi:hypothetical protein